MTTPKLVLLALIDVAIWGLVVWIAVGTPERSSAVLWRLLAIWARRTAEEAGRVALNAEAQYYRCVSP